MEREERSVRGQESGRVEYVRLALSSLDCSLDAEVRPLLRGTVSGVARSVGTSMFDLRSQEKKRN